MVQQRSTTTEQHSEENSGEWIGIHAQDPEHTELFDSLVDRHLPWIPIHRVRKNRSLCWTHYLCQDSSLKVLKCKHCGGFIAHVGKDRSSTSRFRSHLKHHHRIDPNSDYYVGTSLLPPTARARGSRGPQDNGDSNGASRSSSGATSVGNEGARTFEAVSGPLSTLSDVSRTVGSGTLSSGQGSMINHGKHKPSKERRTVLRTDLLLGIMTASQDLRQSFFDNAVVKELLARLSDFDTLDLPASISHIAQDIDEIILRTIKLNDTNLDSRPPSEPVWTIQALRMRISERMHVLLQMTFFSVAYRHWRTTDISTLFVSFYDPIEAKQYLLLVDAARGESHQARNINEIYPGIGRFIVSEMVGGVSEDKSNSSASTATKSSPESSHVLQNFCAVTEIHRCFSHIFGEASGPGVPDTVMSVGHVPVTNPLLVQIKEFSQNAMNEWQTSISTFDPTNYSSLAESIASLLKLRPLLDILDPPPFTPGNYLDMVHFTDIAQSFNRAFQFFTTAPQQTWQFTLLAVLALDEHLSRILEEMRTNSKFGNHVENCLSAISKFKRRLLGQQHYLLASLLVPTTLFDDQLLITLFQTDSLPAIVDMAVDMIYLLLERYFDAIFGNEQYIAELHFSTTELITVIKHAIRDDIYACLNIVDDVVPQMFQNHCARIGVTKCGENAHGAVYKRNDALLSPLDTFLDIHVPVSRAFQLEKWNALGPIVKFVLKYLNSQPGGTITSFSSFMATYQPISNDDMLMQVLKVKSWDLQFDSAKVDFDHDSLALVCKFGSKG